MGEVRQARLGGQGWFEKVRWARQSGDGWVERAGLGGLPKVV